MKRILVIRLFNLGDIINVTPILRAIRLRFPEAQIHFLVASRFECVVKHNPYIDKTIAVQRKDYQRFIRSKRLLDYDLVLDMHGSVHCSKSTSAEKYRWKYIVPNFNLHVTCNFYKVLEAAGIDASPSPTEIHLSEKVLKRTRRIQSSLGIESGGYVVVHPFTSNMSRDWPLVRYVEWIHAIQERYPDLQTVVLGTSQERQRSAVLLEASYRFPIVDLMGKIAMEQVLAFHKQAAFLISGDTGPMHSAAAFRTPYLGLFGPSWPHLSAPLGEGGGILQKECPAFHYHYLEKGSERLMQLITVEEAVQQTCTLLERGRNVLSRTCSHTSHRENEGEKVLYEFLKEKPLNFLKSYYGFGPSYQPVFLELARAAQENGVSQFMARLSEGGLFSFHVPAVLTELDPSLVLVPN